MRYLRTPIHLHADVYWGTPLPTVAAKSSGSRVLVHLLLERTSSTLDLRRDGEDAEMLHIHAASSSSCDLLLHVFPRVTSSLHISRDLAHDLGWRRENNTSAARASILAMACDSVSFSQLLTCAQCLAAIGAIGPSEFITQKRDSLASLLEGMGMGTG